MNKRKADELTIGTRPGWEMAFKTLNSSVVELIRLLSEKEHHRAEFHRLDKEIQNLVNGSNSRTREAFKAILDAMAVASPTVPEDSTVKPVDRSRKETEALSTEESLALLQVREEKSASKKIKTEAQKRRAKAKRDKLLQKKALALLSEEKGLPSPGNQSEENSFA